jgi:hypothetical protein
MLGTLDLPDLDLDHHDDTRLVEVAAAHLAVPRTGPADSFVLHAPLELIARAALLRSVEPGARDGARRRIVDLVNEYDAYEPLAPSAAPARTWRSVDDVVDWLTAAVAAGDLDGAEASVAWLAGETSAAELVACLADLMVARTSAAGHGSIFLWLLPRVLAADPTAPALARPLVRELARHPDWELTWMQHLGTGEPSHDLRTRLLHVPSPGDPGSNFIFPTMSLVERSGLAADLLGPAVRGLSVSEARRDLLRVAAMSMLQDDPANAPYGWSHALTMPQATLGVASACDDPQRAIAVAATFVLGFRATQSSVALDPTWAPEPPMGPVELDALFERGPTAAAAAVWHADHAALPDLRRRLATVAAVHPDAHLAKYTLACFDAARDDPAADRLFLSAAAFLGAWWVDHDRGS